MNTRKGLAAVLAVGVLVGAAGAALAGPKKFEGTLTTPQAPAYGGVTAQTVGFNGTDTASYFAFAAACNADRVAILSGNPGEATNIATFLTSPVNGLDAMVFDIEDEAMGAFEVKGPGPNILASDPAGIFGDIPDYDLDLDFFTTPDIDADSYTGGSGCPDANIGAAGDFDHKCWSHKPTPDEKVDCITGYEDASGKTHGARFVVVSGNLNTVGTLPFTLTTP